MLMPLMQSTSVLSSLTATRKLQRSLRRPKIPVRCLRVAGGGRALGAEDSPSMAQGCPIPRMVAQEGVPGGGAAPSDPIAAQPPEAVVLLEAEGREILSKRYSDNGHSDSGFAAVARDLPFSTLRDLVKL